MTRGSQFLVQVPTSGDSRDLDDGFEEIGGFPRSSGAQEEPEGRQGPKGPLRALKGPGRAKWPLKGQGPKGPLRALKGPKGPRKSQMALKGPGRAKWPLRALKEELRGPGRAKWPLKGQGPLRALKGPLRAGLMWTLLSTMWH